jgi:hypothetical protein
MAQKAAVKKTNSILYNTKFSVNAPQMSRVSQGISHEIRARAPL